MKFWTGNISPFRVLLYYTLAFLAVLFLQSQVHFIFSTLFKVPTEVPINVRTFIVVAWLILILFSAGEYLGNKFEKRFVFHALIFVFGLMITKAFYEGQENFPGVAITGDRIDPLLALIIICCGGACSKYMRSGKPLIFLRFVILFLWIFVCFFAAYLLYSFQMNLGRHWPGYVVMGALILIGALRICFSLRNLRKNPMN